jgi:hypothetical protein
MSVWAKVANGTGLSGRQDGKVTNRVFAETDKRFVAACRAAGIPATVRQASKYRRGYGIANQE